MQHRIAVAAMIVAALGVTGSAAIPAVAAAAASAPSFSVRLITHQAPSAPYPLRCAVTATNVNYRRGPGVQYSSFGQLGRGFQFDSDGGIPNPRNRLEYWNNLSRPGHADAYIDGAYTYCWLA